MTVTNIRSVTSSLSTTRRRVVGVRLEKRCANNRVSMLGAFLLAPAVALPADVIDAVLASSSPPVSACAVSLTPWTRPLTRRRVVLTTRAKRLLSKTLPRKRALLDASLE
jgi:hypothetical protein